MADETVPGQESPTPAPPPPAGNAPAGEYDPRWLESLDERRMADVQAWGEHYHSTKVKGVDAELQSLRTQLGVAKKAADPAIVAMLGDHDTFLTELKQAAATLYGISEEDVKEAQTVRELRLLMRGLRTAQGGRAPAPPAAEAQTAMKEFIASRQPSGAAREPMVRAGGMPPQQVDAETIDKLWLEGKVSDQDYRTFLNRRT